MDGCGWLPWVFLFLGSVVPLGWHILVVKPSLRLLPSPVLALALPSFLLLLVLGLVLRVARWCLGSSWFRGGFHLPLVLLPVLGFLLRVV